MQIVIPSLGFFDDLERIVSAGDGSSDTADPQQKGFTLMDTSVLVLPLYDEKRECIHYSSLFDILKQSVRNHDQLRDLKDSLKRYQSEYFGRISSMLNAHPNIRITSTVERECDECVKFYWGIVRSLERYGKPHSFHVNRGSTKPSNYKADQLTLNKKRLALDIIKGNAKGTEELLRTVLREGLFEESKLETEDLYKAMLKYVIQTSEEMGVRIGKDQYTEQKLLATAFYLYEAMNVPVRVITYNGHLMKLFNFCCGRVIDDVRKTNPNPPELSAHRIGYHCRDYLNVASITVGK